MVINKNTSLTNIESIFKQSSNKQIIQVTKDVALDKEKMHFILKTFPNVKITILSGYDKEDKFSIPDQLFDNDELKTLSEIVNMARQEFNHDITFDELFSLEEAINASKVIIDKVNEINNARVNNRPLSPYEKFLFAYEFVIDRVYQQEEAYQKPAISRNLISVLNGDRIVCVGYASMLSTLCERLGIPCTLESCTVYDKDKRTYINHATCSVRIHDDIYNIHGIFHSDPTTDRKKIIDNVRSRSFSFSLLPYREVGFIDGPHKRHIDRFAYYDTLTDITTNNSIEAPKILSFLFPEISNGKTQGQFALEFAQEQLSKSNIIQIFKSLVDNIDEKNAKKDLDVFISRLLHDDLLSSSKNDAFFKVGITKKIQELLSFGYSKKEISDLFVKKYTGLNKPASDLEIIYRRLNMINDIIENIDDNLVNKIDIVENALENLKIESIENTFKVEPCKKSLLYVGILLKQGYPLDIIKQYFKNQICLADFEDLYLSNIMYGIANTDEKEFYSELYSVKEVFNLPYVEAYNELTQNAHGLSFKNLFNAFVNIYISKGYTAENAKLIAKNLLIHSHFYQNGEAQSISVLDK